MGKLLHFDPNTRNPIGQRNPTHNSTSHLRLKAHQGMQDFIDIRNEIRNQAEELSVYYKVRSPPKPEDFELRFARVAYAMYLIDTLEKMLHVADRSDSASILGKFEPARSAMSELLDGSYFSKTAKQITDWFLGSRNTIASCGFMCGIEILPPAHAVNSYNMKVAALMDMILWAHGYP